MNPLYRNAYPQLGDNVRRNYLKLESEITIANGTSEYKFFNSAPTNKFLANKQFPLAGDEAFEVDTIELELSSPLLHTDLDNADQILLNSFLEIKRGDVDNIQIPLSEILTVWVPDYVGSDAAGQYTNYREIKAKKTFINRILLNSNQRTTFRLFLASAAATELDTITIRCKLWGWYYEKFVPFNMVPVPGEFEFIDYIMYHNFLTSTANANEYALFADKTLSQEFLSKGLPLSNDERFDVHAIKVFFHNSDTGSTPHAFYNNRRTNVLKIKIGDTDVYEASVGDFMCFTQAYAGTFNDNAGSPVATNIKVNHYRKVPPLFLEVPIVIPPQKDVKITLSQPGSSDGEATDYASVMLLGEYGRRVAQ